MAEKDVFVVDDEDDEDWGEEFNFVPNVNSIPPPISLDKSFELPEHEQMQDMEYMDPIANDPEPSPPTSNMFGKFLSKEDKSEAAELDKQEVIQECATMLENNEQEFEEPQSDLASLPNKKEEIHHIQNDLSGKKETPEKETQPKIDRPLPKTKEDVYLCLKKELDEDVLDVDYITRVVHQYMYIPSELRSQIWPLLLHVDLSMVESLKDRESWEMEQNELNKYDQYYIKEKINQLDIDQKDVLIPYVQWIADGYKSLSMNPYTPYLLNLSLLLHTNGFTKETALCCILKLLNNNYLDGSKTCIYSNTENYVATNMHRFFALLLKYHNPQLYNYLNAMNPYWYNPLGRYNDYKPPVEEVKEKPNESAPKMDGVIPLFASIPQTIIHPHEPLPIVNSGYINTDYFYRGYLYTNIDIDGISSDSNLYFYDYMILEGNCTLYMFVFLAMMMENEQIIMNVNHDNMEICLNNLYTNYKTLDQFTHILSYAISLRSLTPLTVLSALISLYSQTCTDVSQVIQGNTEVWTKRLTRFYKHYNPSKLNHIASLLKQWKGQEELFEYNVMKNYHVTRVLSREIFYVSNALCDQNSKSAMKGIDLEHAFAIDISPIEVCEKAIVKHENRDIDHLYFIVDLREEAAINVGCFGNSLQIESRIWSKPLQIEGYIHTLEQLKSIKHIILMDWGCPSPERYEEERKHLLLAYNKLFGLGFPNISICTNGFYGIHEYIRKHQYTDYILNHDKENCEVCLNYRFDDMINKAKEKTEHFLNVASNSVSQFATSSVSSIKKKLPSEEATKNGIKNATKKAGSLLNSALKWSKEKTNKWIQEYEQKAKAEAEAQEAANQQQTESKPTPTFFTIEEEEEEEEMSTAQMMYRSLLEGSKFIKEKDVISTEKYLQNNGVLYKVQKATSLFLSLDPDTLYYYMLFGSRFMVLRALPDQIGKATVLANWSVSNISRLTFKKGDKSVITLYIQRENSGETEVLRGSLSDPTGFATTLQEMISKCENE